MQAENESVLQNARNEKIKSLGFLCYNLYVDGVMVFPEMNGIVDEIRKTLGYLVFLRRNNMNFDYIQLQEKELNEKLSELGCVCYNLYVDSRLFNSNVLSLCDSISTINHEITAGFSPSPQYAAAQCGDGGELSEKKLESGLKVTCPYGMEPIPINFKQCVCGYRNKSEAWFCGKCGAKLS